MKVTPIAYTYLLPTEAVFSETPFGHRACAGDDADADLLAEYAGRQCYESWDLPNPQTAENDKYLANILRQKHESLLEHASVTFKVEGVSRSLLLELERHRFLSFSVRSQRYVNEDESEIVIPPAVQSSVDHEMIEQKMREHHALSRELYSEIFDEMSDEGYNTKQSREAARAVLPGGTATNFIVTGNLRCWRDVLSRRLSVAADAEMREFAVLIFEQLREIAPNSMQALPE